MPRVPGLRLVAPAVIALLTVGGLGAAPSAGAVEPADVAMAGAPTVGQCYAASTAEAWAESLTEAPVACSQDHTLRVTGVVRVPASVDLTDLGGAGMATVAATCAKSLSKVVGANPLHRFRTLYALFVFIPTATQRAAGAHWASCFAGLPDTKGVNDLPSGRLPKATRKPVDAVAYCLTTQKQAVTCAEKHAYRAAHTSYVRTPRSEKGTKAVLRRAAAGTCTRTAGGDAYFTGHRLTEKKAVLVCLRKTRR